MPNFEEMKKEYRFELHYHTKETSPCADLPAADGIRQYHIEGYDGVLVTDHFTACVEGEKEKTTWQEATDRFLKGFHVAEKAGKDCGVAVFLGAEIRFPENVNDYLVIGLTEELVREHEWLYEMSLPEFYEFAGQNGLLLFQAHPFRTACGVTPADPNYLDGVEIWNGHVGHDSHNNLAAAFAKENNLIPIVGSDCHYFHAVGTTAVIFEQMPKTTQDIAALLKQGAYRLETERKKGRQHSNE